VAGVRLRVHLAWVGRVSVWRRCGTCTFIRVLQPTDSFNSAPATPRSHVHTPHDKLNRCMRLTLYLVPQVEL
jgi:hypothetical protein